MRKGRSGIYHSWRHVGVTIAIVILPFLFFLSFSRIAHLTSARLLGALTISILRLGLAYVIAVSLAWGSAVAFYRGRRAAVALPIFDVLQSFPTFAALPLATYAWGVRGLTVIVFLVFTILWPIFFALVSSLKLIRRDWEEAVLISGLSGMSYLRFFLFPASVPGLITGSIIGLGEGWEALVATELIVGVKSGLGSFFGFYAQNPAITAFGILGLLLLIFSINKLIWLPLLERSHRAMEG